MPCYHLLSVILRLQTIAEFALIKVKIFEVSEIALKEDNGISVCLLTQQLSQIEQTLLTTIGISIGWRIMVKLRYQTITFRVETTNVT